MQDNRQNTDLNVCLYWPGFLTLPLEHGLRGPCSLRSRLKIGRGTGEFPSYSHFSPLLHPPHLRRLQLQRRLNLFSLVHLWLGKLHLI